MKRLYVVGIGPGSHRGMTIAADEALREAEIIIGYSKYVELVRPYYPHKEYRDTGMTRETERCALALEPRRQDRGSGLQRRQQRLRHGGPHL